MVDTKVSLQRATGERCQKHGAVVVRGFVTGGVGRGGEQGIQNILSQKAKSSGDFLSSLEQLKKNEGNLFEMRVVGKGELQLSFTLLIIAGPPLFQVRMFWKSAKGFYEEAHKADSRSTQN